MEKDLSVFLAEIEYDYKEILSMIKIIRDATENENKDIEFNDISKCLDVVITKFSNTNNNLQKTLIEIDT